MARPSTPNFSAPSTISGKSVTTSTRMTTPACLLEHGRPVDHDLARRQIHFRQIRFRGGHPVLLPSAAAYDHQLAAGRLHEVRDLAERDPFEVRHAQADEIRLIKLALA